MQQEQHKNSFLNGFSVGLLAGAAAYFLFATDKGKKIRSDFKDKWPEFAAKLQADGLISDSQQSIGSLIGQIFENSTSEASKTKKKTKPSTKSPQKKKPATRPASKKLKFKGV